MTVEIVGGVERIVGVGDIARKNRSVQFGFVPLAGLHGIGEFLAVNANLPGQQSIAIEFGLAEFC